MLKSLTWWEADSFPWLSWVISGCTPALCMRDCRWSVPHTCLWVPGLTPTQLHRSAVSHLTPCPNSVSASQVFTPLGLVMWNLRGLKWVISHQNTLADKSVRWGHKLNTSNALVYFLSSSESTQSNVYVCVLYHTVGCGYSCPALSWWVFSLLFIHFATWDPAWACMIAHLPVNSLRFNVRPRKYHQQRNLRIARRCHENVSFQSPCNRPKAVKDPIDGKA